MEANLEHNALTAPLPASTQLAIERTLLAHERTLMAWIRTAASLISFGFTIYKFIDTMKKSSQLEPEAHILGSRNFGLLMITIGIAALALATIQHIVQTNKLKHEYGVKSRSLSVVVAGLISLLGIAGFLAVFYRQ